jgi:hypothetical protein
MRSQTARSPRSPRRNGEPDVAFDMASLPRHPGLSRRSRVGGLFRGSILSLPVPLSTLRLRRYRRLRMTRGRCRWLNFQRMSPSDTTTRQSPGARCLTLPSSGPPPAWPASLLLSMFRCAGQAGGGPLMSNVRQRRNTNTTSSKFVAVLPTSAVPSSVDSGRSEQVTEGQEDAASRLRSSLRSTESQQRD